MDKWQGFLKSFPRHKGEIYANYQKRASVEYKRLKSVVVIPPPLKTKPLPSKTAIPLKEHIYGDYEYMKELRKSIKKPKKPKTPKKPQKQLIEYILEQELEDRPKRMTIAEFKKLKQRQANDEWIEFLQKFQEVRPKKRNEKLEEYLERAHVLFGLKKLTNLKEEDKKDYLKKMFSSPREKDDALVAHFRRSPKEFAMSFVE